MTKNEIVTFEGEVRWASIPPNDARKPPAEYINPSAPNNTFYSIEVECTKEKLTELFKKGVSKLTTLKTDEATGKTYVKVKASKVRRIEKNGEMQDIVFEDPYVKNENGENVEDLIANGSKAIVEAELAPTKKGVQMRLRGVKVTNLIPFIKGVKEETIDDFIRQ